MAAFNKKENSGGRKNRPDRNSGPGKDKAGAAKSKDGYKTKRSFTKNKSFRDLNLSKDETGGKERKPFRRSFDKSDKPAFKKREGGFGERGDRKTSDGFKPRTDRDDKDREHSSRDKFPKRDGESRERRERPSDGTRSREGRDKFPKREGETRERRERSSEGERPRESRESLGRDKFAKGDGETRERRERPFDGERKRESRDAFPKREGESRERRERPVDGERSRESRDKYPKREGSAREERSDKRGDRRSDDKSGSDRENRRVKFDEFQDGKSFSKTKSGDKKAAPQKKNEDGTTRLNKYLSNAGIASRRDADQLILGGTVKVNGVVVDQLGYKIKPGDKVTYGDSAVKSERKVYLLLNKPKDYITTMEDPRDRKTVMELVEGVCRERIYPVGRLDRNTTGLLLFTNDGEMTTKLTHPKFGVKKVYHVSLNKGLKPDDFTSIIEGVELEDGVVKADDLAFVGEGKKEVGIEIHSGKNRVVRRIFEQLGYDVIKLDRVVFAGLTKKDLPRGKHRFLTAKEISFLQMIG